MKLPKGDRVNSEQIIKKLLVSLFIRAGSKGYEKV